MPFVHQDMGFWMVTSMMLIVVGGAIATLTVLWIASRVFPTLTPRSDIDVARQRYASGEITKEQLEEIVRRLGGRLA